MKLEGARDFLMRGEATLPLESFFNIHLTDLGH